MKNENMNLNEESKGSPVLVAENLSVLIKDRFLVKNVSFSVEKGEVLGIVGDKKSGKTSLIKAISGSLPINPEQVKISDVDIFYDKKILTKVSTCFDPPVFFKYQTVYQNIKFLSMLNNQHSKENIIKVLSKFEIAGKMDVKVKKLTYVEKKLMSLALALLTQPTLLLLDEPFKNIPTNKLQLIKDAIKEIKEQGTSIIMTSMNLEGLEDECDRVILMEKREIKQILDHKELERLENLNSYAFVKVKYPHFAGKVIMENFGLKVKILDKRVLFQTDEDTLADIVKSISRSSIPLYSAGYLNKKAEKIFAELAPYFKEENL